MRLAPRLLCTALVAFALGAAAGARADGELAAYYPEEAAAQEPTATEAKTLQAVLWSEARHLGSEIRESVGGPEGARLILSILGTGGSGSGHPTGWHGGLQ